MPADRGPSGTGHDTAGCERHKGDPHNLCEECWKVEPPPVAVPGPAAVSPAERAADYLERAIEADKEIVPLELPAGAIQLLYDVLGHFPHAPGSWHTAARAYCSIALMEARDGR